MRKFCAFLMVTWLAAPALAQPDSFSATLEPVMPAVVNISTTQRVTAQALPGMPMFDFDALGDDPQSQQFKELFRQFNERFGGDMSREVTSLGSGFVIDPTGYVVTNNHVIANAENITVIFGDDTHLPATVVGHDPKTDLALIKVKTDKALPFVKFGDSDKLKVGDWVIAVGNPFGLGGSVSAGIVSARGRNINAGPFDDFIQTDAAINRGNSGGPLFNAQGEVVGINSAIFSPTGGSVGIGFAVPSAMAKPILEQLRKTGTVQRGWLGVKIQEVTEETANALGMGAPRGALVLEVSGPAKGSGIAVGDVIVKFAGRPLQEMRILPRMVAETKVGTPVDVTVWRKGKEYNYRVKLGELPGEKAAKPRAKTVKPAPEKSRTVLGMVLTPLSSELRAELELPDTVQGLVVTDMDRMGEAAKRGVLPGDVILDVNQQPVDSLKALHGALAAAKREGKEFALMRVQRGKSVQFITVPIK